MSYIDGQSNSKTLESLLTLYEQYEEILKPHSAHFSLSGILREETNHLNELGARAKHSLAINGIDPELVCEIENAEFKILWNEIENEVAKIKSKTLSEVVV